MYKNGMSWAGTRLKQQKNQIFKRVKIQQQKILRKKSRNDLDYREATKNSLSLIAKTEE